MASEIVVNLDTSKEKYESYKCKQNDDLTLIANIYENGAAKDLTNCSIVVQAKKSDNTYVIQNADITKSNNTFTTELVRDFTRAPGETKIEVVLVESGKQNTTFSFCLEVIGSVIRGAEESKDLITSLEVMQDAVVEMGKISEETKELIQNSGAASKEEMNKVNTQLADMMNYLGHRIPTRDYFKNSYNVLSCFGDSITAGDFNIPIENYYHYPTILQQILCNNSEKTKLKIVEDKNNYYTVVNHILGTGVSYSNGEYTLDSSLGDFSPRFVSDWVSIDFNYNYLFKLELDNSLSINKSTTQRVAIGDDSNTSLGEFYINAHSTQSNYNTLIAYLNTKYIKELYPTATKIRVGARLSASETGKISKVRNLELYKTYEQFNSFNLLSEGLSYDKGNFLLSSATITQPRLVTPFASVELGKKYLFEIEFDDTSCKNQKIEPRFLIANSSNTILKDIIIGTTVNRSGNTTNYKAVIDIDYYKTLYPDFTKYSFGIRLTGTDTLQRLVISKVSLKELDGGVLVSNDGLSGDTTAGALTRINNVINKLPNVCIVAFGTNDIRQGVTLETYLNNITSIINMLKSNNITPILATLPPLDSSQSNYDKIPEWNMKIKVLGAKLGVQIHDRWWALNDGDLSYIEDDRHPTKEGYELLADSMYNILLGKRFD